MTKKKSKKKNRSTTANTRGGSRPNTAAEQNRKRQMEEAAYRNTYEITSSTRIQQSANTRSGNTRQEQHRIKNKEKDIDALLKKYLLEIMETFKQEGKTFDDIPTELIPKDYDNEVLLLHCFNGDITMKTTDRINFVPMVFRRGEDIKSVVAKYCSAAEDMFKKMYGEDFAKENLKSDIKFRKDMERIFKRVWKARDEMPSSITHNQQMFSLVISDFTNTQRMKDEDSTSSLAMDTGLIDAIGKMVFDGISEEFNELTKDYEVGGFAFGDDMVLDGTTFAPAPVVQAEEVDGEINTTLGGLAEGEITETLAEIKQIIRELGVGLVEIDDDITEEELMELAEGLMATEEEVKENIKSVMEHKNSDQADKLTGKYIPKSIKEKYGLVLCGLGVVGADTEPTKKDMNQIIRGLEKEAKENNPKATITAKTHWF